MGQDNTGPNTTKDQSVDGLSQHDQTSQDANNAAHDPSGNADLLHAAHILPPPPIAQVELTLDQLSETVDLFDVSPFDYGDAI
jgi:hypothetical protein